MVGRPWKRRPAGTELEPVGALVLGDRLSYAPPVDEAEVYIELPLTSRAHHAQGVGPALIVEVPARDTTVQVFAQRL
jgi:hypothetical protein